MAGNGWKKIAIIIRANFLVPFPIRDLKTTLLLTCHPAARCRKEGLVSLFPRRTLSITSRFILILCSLNR